MLLTPTQNPDLSSNNLWFLSVLVNYTEGFRKVVLEPRNLKSCKTEITMFCAQNAGRF
jgi:hypothetical protein